jgi:hypothetical protein
MGESASRIFPFAIAVILPPAGLIMGLAGMQEDRDLGRRLVVVSILAAVVWALVLVA